MTKDEKVFFELLTMDRVDSAKTLEKPSMRGVQRSVVEKYSDQAHFIYELLQNADDVGATYAKFELYKDRLVFIHNGKRLFSVTDPRREDEDAEKEKLGDINAITSIANSNKTGASIGKFGVGFKAVFQYTETPIIYDPNVSFRIERFIVPVLINEEYKGKLENETVFVFPFNHKRITAEHAYEDICGKLKKLVYPTLFLRNLEKVTYIIGAEKGEYIKKVIETNDYDNTKCDFLSISSGEETSEERVFLFSRTTEDKYTYSVGFFVDANFKLVPKQHYAFCFFPTKTTTGLAFIINAPFLLTDSREGIKANDAHNLEMIQVLSKLAADSFVLLRDIGISKQVHILDDDILNMIPYDEKLYMVEDEGADLSFYPFYLRVKEILSREEVFLSGDEYVSMRNGYIANSTAITNVFKKEQLKELYGDEEAGWIFETYGYETIYRSRDGRGAYLQSLLQKAVVLDERILIKMSDSFIEKQNIEWLLCLYEFIADTSRRVVTSKCLPIFLDDKRKAHAAFNTEGHEILFIPTAGVDGFDVILTELYEHDATKKIASLLEMTQPSFKDEVYNKIITKYKNDEASISDAISDFKKIFAYYKDCPQSEIKQLVSIVKDCAFLLYNQGEKTYRASASGLYYPTEELVEYFLPTSNVRFVDVDLYKSNCAREDYELMHSFFVELGMKERPQLVEHRLSYYEAYKLRDSWPYCTPGREQKWIETRLDGSVELVNYITLNKDQHKSLLLWNMLAGIQTSGGYWRFPLGGEYHYYRYSPGMTRFNGPADILLKTSAWILTREGHFISPMDASLAELNEMYDVESFGAQKLISYLEINCVAEEEVPDNLTENQVNALEMGKRLLDEGVSKEELEEFLREKRRKQERDIDNAVDILTTEDEEIIQSNIPQARTHEQKVAGQIVKKAISEKTTVDDFVKRQGKKEGEPFEREIDADEFSPSAVDYKKRIESAKEKSSAEIAKIAMLEAAQERAISAEKYTQEWFAALLDLEILNSAEVNSNSREIHINFSKVEKEVGTNSILILKYPSQYIPQMMEELSDILLSIHTRGEIKQIPIEVASVKGYTLRVKIKSSASLDRIDLDSVTQATIDAQSPVFLLDALKKEWDAFDFEDHYNLRDNLTKDIDFVFGPPGTGKTTYISKEVIIPLVNNNKKILVLAPTNKAADVITQRILENVESIDDAKKWLIRFGATADESIEKSGVHKDREFNFGRLEKCVLITTIARLPYDYFFTPNHNNLLLNTIEWDYIVFDESSMIPLYQVLYPLYKFTPNKFVFAGDPFQIEPITAVDLWKGENIYSFVGLESFTDTSSVLNDYKVHLLTTQYRSIPTIGTIFSELTYGGVLEHSRSEDSKRKYNISDIIDLNILNIIKFPVSKYESIYKSRRLNSSSPYHLYSALFSFEFVRFLAEIINTRNYGEKLSIGVVAPYKSQADLIDKLLSSVYIPRNIEIQVGTIHGFQGDESDIVVAVFNPPPSISDSKEMFLNRQNIINVSISRARDCLIVIMPDNDTEKVNMLKLIKKVESLCRVSGKCNTFTTGEIEEIMFDKYNFIEENTFSTGHQMVNVYGLPEKRYEIRSESTAIDVQVHGIGKKKFRCFEESNEVEQITKDEPRTQNIIDDDGEFFDSDEESIFDRMIGEIVRHTKFGKGVIKECEGNKVVISFDGGEHKFQFPDAFKDFLEAIDGEIQKEIIELF